MKSILLTALALMLAVPVLAKPPEDTLAVVAFNVTVGLSRDVFETNVDPRVVTAFHLASQNNSETGECIGSIRIWRYFPGGIDATSLATIPSLGLSSDQVFIELPNPIRIEPDAIALWEGTLIRVERAPSIGADCTVWATVYSEPARG